MSQRRSSESSKVVYLSQRVTLNSDINSGGGTDVGEAINAILATASESNPLKLIWDGVALTSQTIFAREFTDIYAIPGCGYFLKSGSNCLALGNRLNGSSIVDSDISIRGLKINCNGANQDKWEGAVNLDSTTQTATTVNGNAVITLSAANAIVAVGMKVTGTGIQSGSYVQSVSGTSVTLTKTASAGGTVSLFFKFDSDFDRAIGWNYGAWFSGFKNLKLSGIEIIDAKTFAFALGNGNDFVIEKSRAFWSDNDGVTITNNNRDGIHMFGGLDTGHIVDFYTNGDDDPLAFNTDEGALLGDARRGSLGDISNIVAENIHLDNSVNGFRFYGSCGTGTLKNITIRNVRGTIINGQQACAAATVAGTTYLGRIADAALASVENVTIEGWQFSATSPGKTDLTLNDVAGLRLSSIPESVKFAFVGVEDYFGERAPTWQRVPFTPGAFYSSGSSGGGGVNTGGPIGFSGMNVYSGVSNGDYGLVQWQRTINGYGSPFSMDVIDWTIYFEARLQFQMDSTHVSSSTRYRWLLGRTDSDQTHPNTTSGAGRWLNGIGIEVNDLELWLVVNRHGTVKLFDTGYAVTADRTERITLRNVGNGIVRVYADEGGVATLLYSTTADDGPVDTDQSGSNIEIHSTLVADDPNYNLVEMSNMEIKR